MTILQLFSNSSFSDDVFCSATLLDSDNGSIASLTLSVADAKYFYGSYSVVFNADYDGIPIIVIKI